MNEAANTFPRACLRRSNSTRGIYKRKMNAPASLMHQTSAPTLNYRSIDLSHASLLTE